MAQFILTGQPPRQGGRVAVGPLLSREAAEDCCALLCRRGWTEVWLLPLQTVDRTLVSP